MRLLAHTLVGSRSKGVPLPDRFTPLGESGIRFRRGQVHVIAGQPGSGKSLLALDYVGHMNVSTLYFSADSDEDTVVNRIGAMRLNMPVSEVEEMRDTPAEGVLEAELAELSQVRFVFDATPTLDTIDLELKAWNEVYGTTPDIVVIDNLINVVCESTDNEWQGLRHLMSAMKDMAQTTGSAVIVLHHTSEGEGKPTDPQPRKALMGKVAQLPELILTIAHDPGTGEFKVCPVKNRSGKATANAAWWVSLHVDLSRMKLSATPPALSQEMQEAMARTWDSYQ